MSDLRRMPAEVRRLRDPWPSVVGRVRHLTADLERSFRAGQRVTQLEAGFVIGGSMKGGTSSMWLPTSREAREAYEGWRAIEGMEPSDDRTAFDALVARATELGLELLQNGDDEGLRPGTARFEPRFARAYELVLEVIPALPTSHLGRPELRAIELGGWGHDGAKASAYRDGAVHIYDFALKGARRTFLGIFLHELGHAQERAFTHRDQRRIERAHAMISRAQAFYGIEFLMTPKLRIAYQRMAVCEFMAETYLAYAACGASLRRFIMRQTHSARDAWLAVYSIYRDAFDGIEYA